jgi:uncharacterized protein YcbX
MAIRIEALRRYPVKGLSAEPLERMTLAPLLGVPEDRRFAIAHAATRFDPARPEWLHKTHFIMLMRDEKLAELTTRFDERSELLIVSRGATVVLRERITEAAGRRAIDGFFTEFLKETLPGPVRVVEAPGRHTFHDAKHKPGAAADVYVSLVNLASIEAVAAVAGVPVDPIRFRANVYHRGAPAWAEHAWQGSEIQLGKARLRVIAPIVRCAATSVNPLTAERDLNVPALLQREFGHNYMGVYGEVIAGGPVAVGDALVTG